MRYLPEDMAEYGEIRMSGKEVRGCHRNVCPVTGITQISAFINIHDSDSHELQIGAPGPN